MATALFLQAASVSAREACHERTLGLRYSPQARSSWCWAASGQMVMEWLGADPERTCQCRQAELLLGVSGCCAPGGSCAPAADAPDRCDAARWPAFVDGAERYRFDYRTTCDDLAGRQDDDACHARPLGWLELTAEICGGRPVLAAFRSAGSTLGHLVVVKGFSTHPDRRVLLADPRQLCPPGRDCEGELDEGFWLSYDEFAAGWGGLEHWVDFFGMRRTASAERPSGVAPTKGRSPAGKHAPTADQEAFEGPRDRKTMRAWGPGRNKRDRP